MQGIGQILKSKLPEKNKNIHSEIHYLADEISTFFGERGRFGMYLGAIKRIGVQEAKRIFSEVKQADCDNKIKLFFWKTKKNANIINSDNS
ncbi:MAG: hypothetical protein HZC05_01405 [Candidatus Magasanikbacteria bacterium]|nr:hypothetical protein [Candidatus Magasanikbacteria bacterium]